MSKQFRCCKHTNPPSRPEASTTCNTRQTSVAHQQFILISIEWTASGGVFASVRRSQSSDELVNQAWRLSRPAFPASVPCAPNPRRRQCASNHNRAAFWGPKLICLFELWKIKTRSRRHAFSRVHFDTPSDPGSLPGREQQARCASHRPLPQRWPCSPSACAPRLPRKRRSSTSTRARASPPSLRRRSPRSRRTRTMRPPGTVSHPRHSRGIAEVRHVMLL
jgi:hypothetical protein